MKSDRLHETLVHELKIGKMLVEAIAKQQKEPSSSNGGEKFAEKILSSYSEALLILSGGGRRATQGQCQTDPPDSSTSLCNVTQSKDSSSGLLKRRSREDKDC